MGVKRLIVVSNREPYKLQSLRGKLKLEKTVGGLVSSLEPILERYGGVWVCGGRRRKNYPTEVIVKEKILIRFVPLSRQDVKEYYYGFSNEVLWPLCHLFLSRANFDRSYWKGYRRVNKKFAKVVLEVIREGDLIFINDYHLTLLPSLLREEGVKNKIFFFWHIPFPPCDMFRFIPNYKEIIEGMLGADVLGFHIRRYVRNFKLCCKEFLEGARSLDDYILYRGRKTKLKALPIGIDYKKWRELRSSRKCKIYARNIKRKLGVEFLGIGVDRLDYTKGFVEKLKGIEKFFTKYPSFKGRMTFIQVAPLSRSDIEEYKRIRERTDHLVGRLEGELSEVGWLPIHYYHNSFSEERLASFYYLGDFALITPIIDGLNLVAKEFVASTEKGVLILSKFAGVSEQLKEGAILINPFDEYQIAEAIYYSLKMPERERRERLKAMREVLQREDINWWLSEFFEGEF